MNKILKLAFLFLFLTNIACAQNEKTLLWRVSGNGLSEPSYLYGTIHIPHTKFMNFSDSMKRVLKTVNSVVVEVHETNPFAGMSGMSMENGKSLKTFLGEKDYATLENRIEADRDLALLASVLENMKPLLVSTQLSMQHAETNTIMPMDFVFTIKAKERNQKVIGLETYKEQYDAIEKIDIEEQINALRDVLYDTLQDQKDMQTLINAYLEQDIDELMKVSMDFGNKYPDVLDKLITQRNIKMISRTDSLLKLESNRLVAIGAAHLGGNDGFIAVLRKKGYTVEPVMPTYTEEAKMEIDYNPEWIAFQTDDFECEFPNEKPEEKKYQDRYALDQFINGEKTNFSVSIKEMENEDNKTREMFYDELKTNIQGAQKDAPMKDITINGLSAVETQMNMMGQTMRTIYITNEEVTKALVIIILGEKQITEADFADYFINSFTFK